MIPIEKNIIVTDEYGNEYEATYLRRAKGLVKNGRARFIDKNTICLACPPNNLEDNIMNKHKQEDPYIALESIEKPIPPMKPDSVIPKSDSNSETVKLNMDYVLTRIDKIIEQNQYIKDAVTAIGHMTVNESEFGGNGDSARAEAISTSIAAREATNRQIIKFLKKMYNDII